MQDLKTLYVSRPLINGTDLVKWAKSVGFDKTLQPQDMHVTIAFSRKPVDWGLLAPETNNMRNSSSTRRITPLGDKGAIVLKFESNILQNRWAEFIESGCSWDYPSYQPHVSITYDGDKNRDYGIPYDGKLVFGPEKFTEVVEDWDKKVKET